MRRAVLVVAVCALGAAAAPAAASIPPPGVPNANHRVGHPANKIAPGFTLTKIAQGSNPLENPSGLITKFGFLNDGSHPARRADEDRARPEHLPGVQARPPGADPRLRLRHALPVPGRTRLVEGDLAYVTRINLDVTDPAHRITLLTPVGGDGLTHLNALDGSTWDPFTHTLLCHAGGRQRRRRDPALDWTGRAKRPRSRRIGRGGYEGIHPDDHGQPLHRRGRRRHRGERRPGRSVDARRSPSSRTRSSTGSCPTNRPI